MNTDKKTMRIPPSRTNSHRGRDHLRVGLSAFICDFNSILFRAQVAQWLILGMIAGTILLASSSAFAQRPAQPALDETTRQLLVIAPKAFAHDLDELVQFKQARLPTRLVVLEDLLKTNDGADEAERLKRFLF